MCGIFAIFGSGLAAVDLRKLALKCGKLIRHRGPDWNGVKIWCNPTHSNVGSVAMEHERLAIVKPESGAQPLTNADETIALCVNGEIYNYKLLAAEMGLDGSTFNSDCEIIIPLYERYGDEFVNKLRGMFSFVLYDSTKDRYLAARDYVGITPLYYGYATDGSVWFSSEMKALMHGCVQFKIFPPGHVYNSDTCEFTRWYTPAWLTPGHLGKEPLDLELIRNTLEQAVRRRMMSDVPWGILLSGGLDSSIVAAIAVRIQNRRFKEGDNNNGADTFFSKMHSYTIGLPGSPDLKAAKEVANFLGTVHHSFTFTVQDGIDALEDVIYHLETYDVTTVRASTPMFLMARKIKAMGIKMVLSGEGADEALGGYLYFHKAPNAQQFHEETVDKLMALHQYDCLRANKATSAWGLEVRVPFLDIDFLDVVMEVDTDVKMIKEGRIEKHIIRKAFDTPNDPYLPENILWRQKEQFSDGVGYGWIDALKAYAETHVTNRQMSTAPLLFPYNTPKSKEAYYYRSIFSKHFEKEVAAYTVPGGPSVACSTERALQWDDSFKDLIDPSGRAVTGVHQDAYVAEEFCEK